MDPSESALSPPVVRRVAIRNFKSIAGCAVDLGALGFLVGPNGSGKSNFLEALRFVRDGLQTTLEQAVRVRGGINSVRRRSKGHPTHFGIRLDLGLAGGRTATYAFKVGALREGAFAVQREECRVDLDVLPRQEARYVVEEGRLVEATCDMPVALAADRLALVAVSGRAEFRPVFDALSGMAFYSLSPERIRDLQDPDPGQVLTRDGSNLAAVVRELGRAENGDLLGRIAEHLAAVVPGVDSVGHKRIGPKETLDFRQKVAGDENPWSFHAWEMSDGTLRALGILVAAFQGAAHKPQRVTLVGMEEPEIALHPGSAEAITEVLLMASRKVQVLVTTHSPEILSHKGIRPEHILSVSADSGETVIAPVTPANRSAIEDRLYSAGELLVQGQLEPDREAASRAARQLPLFSDGKE